MSELRQDPITRDWVVVNAERSLRPNDHGAAGAMPCPFCPGNEELTPAPLDRIDGPDGRWRVRAVPNRFPVLSEGGASGPARDTVPPGWQRLTGYGRHEVIVESPEHFAQPGLMPDAQLRLVLEMYVRRWRALAGDRELRQVVLFRNHGVRAGTSLAHPHSQIVGTPAVSPETRRRVMDEIEYFNEWGRCGVCRVLEGERAAGARIVLETAHFVSVAPYASRSPYHLQVVPVRHEPMFAQASGEELDDLASHLTRVLGALHRRLGDPHYNLVVSAPPLDLVHRSASHWLVEIVPRLTTPAGFELGSRIVVNVEPPERAAAELRGALAPAASA
jgi:UDPglucose--hexose-1-phosphate uridylyltransferase